MKNLFEMLQAIFGKNIISRTIGTRTNVIKLPSNKSSPLKNEFDVFRSSENPAVFEKLKKVIEDEAPYISRMNDAERLIYEGNVKRLHDYLVSIGEIKPTITAEVIGLGTKEPIAGKGLASLVEEAGQTSPPGTLIGDIQSRINKLKSLAKEKGMSAEEILQDFAAGQKGMSRLNDEGLVRSTAREILINDIKAGKIKNITVSEAINMGEPLDPFRRIYGEGALEQLDSLIPDFRNLKTEMEAEKFARSKFKFEPDENRLPGSTSIEEGRKAEQEFGINKSTTEVEEPQAEIIPFKKKPEEFAIGGSVGLDYLTGMEPSKDYAEGGRIGFKIGGGKKILDLIAEANKKLKDKKSMETINPKTGEVTTSKEPVKVAEEPRTLGGLPINERSANISDEIDKLRASGINSLENEKKLNRLSLEFVDSLDPRRQKKALDYRRKSLDTENKLIIKAEKEGLDFDTYEKLRQGLYGPRKQQTLDFIKTGKVNVEPVKPTTTFEEVQKRYRIAAKAADEIFPNYNTPKTAASELANVMAEQKYGKVFDDLTGDIQSDLYSEAYDYITSVNRLPKISPPNRPVPPGTEFNISDPKTAEAFTNFARENDPEGFAKIQKIVDDINNKNMLEDFDIKDRKPNAKGGLNYLMGF
jgi:hypothetical protein